MTIKGADLATADAYATAAPAMGVADPAWRARLRGSEGLTFSPTAAPSAPPGFGGWTDR